MSQEPHLYIASAPRLADVDSLGAGFPPGTPRESASRAFGRPQADRAPFFWRHVQEGVFADHQIGIGCGVVVHG